MDYLEDASHQVLHAINKATGIDLMKTAEACNDNVQDLPAHSFADLAQRKFPIHTKEATILSAAYAAFNGVDPVVEEKLTKMAEFWDCQDEVRQVREEIEAFRPPEKWALDMEIDGQPIQAFRYTTGASLKHAAQAFFDQRQRLPYAARVATARHLMKAASDLGVELSEPVNNYLFNVLGIGVPSPDATRQLLMSRKHAMKRVPADRWENDFQKLAMAVEEQLEAMTEDSGQQVVEKFAAFDEVQGLAAAYDANLDMPEDRIFPVPYTKLAGKTRDLVELQNGMVVDVGTLDWEKVSEVDPELYAACDSGDPKTAAEVLPTWPRADVEVLAEMLDLTSAV